MNTTQSKLIGTGMVFFSLFIIFVFFTYDFGTKKHKSPTLEKPISKNTSAFQGCKFINLSDGFDSEDPKFKRFIEKFAELASKDKQSIHTDKKTLLEDPTLKMFENEALENSECGAGAANFLAFIYSSMDLKEKANAYYKISLDFFSKAKKSERVMKYLCHGDNPLILPDQKAQHCQILIDAQDWTPDKHDKLMAYYTLVPYYCEKNKIKELATLCLKADDKTTQHLCTAQSQLLVMQLERKNIHEGATQLYDLLEEISKYDDNGTTESTLASGYLQGKIIPKNLSRAIYWYEKGLEKVTDGKLQHLIMLNDLAAAYSENNDHLNSFRHFKRAAELGFVLSQYNLSKDYAQGRGTIRDYKKSYAWVSIAIAQGLPGSNGITALENHTNAENLKTWLEYKLKKQDNTGEALKEAEALAQQYFNEYVLNEKPEIKKKDDLLSKVKEWLG